MKIVLAPNAFKGCMTASVAAEAMRAGVLAALPNADITMVAVADGGDGLVDVFTSALGGSTEYVTVSDPLGRPIKAGYCLVREEKIAAVEMALASGLALLEPGKRNPLLTSTYGTGELIAEALKNGARKIVIGIGGSSTTDCGIGMATALGAKFLDQHGNALNTIGKEMINVCDIDLSGMMEHIKDTDFEVACDVDNPLTGDKGAARVYGPQKGANPQQVEELERGLCHLAEVIKDKLGVDINNIPGAGAAGGLGAGLMAFLNAKLRKGIELVFDTVKLDEKMKGANLVFTAEGQIDFQTKFGKAPAGVGQLAKKHNCPCIAIAGSVGEGINELHASGITAVFSLCNGPVTLDEAMKNGPQYLQKVTEQVVRTFAASL